MGNIIKYSLLTRTPYLTHGMGDTFSNEVSPLGGTLGLWSSQYNVIMFKEEEKKVVIRSNGMNYLVKRSEVVWIENRNHRTEYQLKNRSLDNAYELYLIAEEFKQLPFLRINRSMIVNLTYLEAHSDNLEEIILFNKRLTVGMGSRNQLQEWLDRELKEVEK